MNRSDLRRSQRPVDEEDLANAVGPRRIDNRFFRRQQVPVAVHGDQVGIGAVGDILDDARRQTDERAVVVDRAIEVASGKQERAGEHEIAEAAVVEVERAPGVRNLLREALEHRGDNSPRPWRNRLEKRRGGSRECIPGRPRIQGVEERQGRGSLVWRRAPAIEKGDELCGTGVERGRQVRRILAKVRRPQAVSQESPHLPRRRAIVVTVDDDGEVDAGAGDKLPGQGGRAASAGKQDHIQGAGRAQFLPVHECHAGNYDTCTLAKTGRTGEVCAEMQTAAAYFHRPK